MSSPETAGWVSAASAHYVDLEAADWTLPEEAFPLRSAPPAPAQAPPPAGAGAAPGFLLAPDDKDQEATANNG